MTPRVLVVPPVLESKAGNKMSTAAPDNTLWQAQPPPEDDPEQPLRWNDEADRTAFYTLYRKLMQH